MSRELSVGQLAAINAKTVRPAHFVLLDFASGAIRLWDGKGDFTIPAGMRGAGTYQGVGVLGGISEIEETKDPVANGVTLTLSGIPSELLAESLDRSDYRGRKCRIWKWFAEINDDANTFTPIGQPSPAFAGRMDLMQPTDTGDTASISLHCENRLLDLERPRLARRTDEDQRRRHPTDGSFRYIVGLQNKEFPWGQKSDAGATGGGGGFTPAISALQ